MQIQINADNHLESSAARDKWASGVVQSAMNHFADQVTRVEVHLSDENAGKGGATVVRCKMEARLTGRPPIVVTHDAPSLDPAVNGAADKLVRATEHAMGRAGKHAHEPRPQAQDDAAGDDFVPSSAPF